jgi:hypothetical protein
VLGLTEVAAYVVISICLVLSFSFFFDWVAVRYDVQLLRVGRRIDVGSLLAIAIGLFAAGRICRWVGLLPPPRTKA